MWSVYGLICQIKPHYEISGLGEALGSLTCTRPLHRKGTPPHGNGKPRWPATRRRGWRHERRPRTKSPTRGQFLVYRAEDGRLNMEETGEGRLLARDARQREAPERRLAVGFGRTATREVRAGTGRPPKLASVREKPATDPAVAKGFGGQGRRSAHHGRGPVAVSPFNFSTF